MALFSTACANKVLDHVVGKTTFTLPVACYVALYTVTPTAAGGGTECTGVGNYARVAVAAASWQAAASGATQNSAAIAFATCATTNWGTVLAFGIFDAITGGNFLTWGPISPEKSITIGDTASFAIGELDLAITLA